MTFAPARIQVRASHVSDADAIAQLEGLSPVTRRALTDGLARTDRRSVVAQSSDNGEVVGFATLLLQPDAGHLDDVVVALSMRGQGIGGALVTRLIQLAAAHDRAEVTLEVSEHNRAALALYRRVGFQVEGRRPRYYPDGSDALIMWRRDGGSAEPFER